MSETIINQGIMPEQNIVSEPSYMQAGVVPETNRTPEPDVTIGIVPETEEKKPYEFRKLSTKDVFLMFRIIGKIGINEFKTVFDDGGLVDIVGAMSDEAKQSDNGAYAAAAVVALDVGNVIFSNIGRCEDEIYQLLSQTSNVPVEKITAEGNAVMFLEMLIDFFKKEEFPAFFKVVSKLFK